MRIALGSIDVTDYERRAIAGRYGEVGLASRETVRQFVVQEGLGAIETVVADLEAQAQRDAEWARE